MRPHFGGYFFGQVGTFMYLVQTMKNAPQFDMATWPQFSLFNLLVANFWPLYWVAYFIDKTKLNNVYWHVYVVAAARAADVIALAQHLAH
jgi:hypothetical protein